MPDSSETPRVLNRTNGRVLAITAEGYCYVAQKYEVFRSANWGGTWQLDCVVPESGWKPHAANIKPLARLLRYNIQALQILDNGSRVAVARDGVYRADADEKRMVRSFKFLRGSRPLNLCAHGSRLIFGEYGDGYYNAEVFLYVSEDLGKTWEIAHRFPTGSIRHVHNVLFDAGVDHYWVFVGDFNEQPGIGALSKDLKHIEWLTRGGQKSRTVGAIITPQCLYYGTDSDREKNYIIRLDKKSGKMEIIREIEGSSQYATSFGPVHVISTCVEPNPACPSRKCSLYISRDGDSWNNIFPHRKDCLNPVLFQFGCLVLPHSVCNQARGMFSGQAVIGAHDRVTLVDFE
jgi:hypothetical protein